MVVFTRCTCGFSSRMSGISREKFWSKKRWRRLNSTLDGSYMTLIATGKWVWRTSSMWEQQSRQPMKLTNSGTITGIQKKKLLLLQASLMIKPIHNGQSMMMKRPTSTANGEWSILIWTDKSRSTIFTRLSESSQAFRKTKWKKSGLISQKRTLTSAHTERLV